VAATDLQNLPMTSPASAPDHHKLWKVGAWLYAVAACVYVINGAANGVGLVGWMQSLQIEWFGTSISIVSFLLSWIVFAGLFAMVSIALERTGVLPQGYFRYARLVLRRGARAADRHPSQTVLPAPPPQRVMRGFLPRMPKPQSPTGKTPARPVNPSAQKYSALPKFGFVVCVVHPGLTLRGDHVSSFFASRVAVDAAASARHGAGRAGSPREPETACR